MSKSEGRCLGYYMGHLVTPFQSQILCAAANNRVCGHAYAPTSPTVVCHSDMHCLLAMRHSNHVGVVTMLANLVCVININWYDFKELRLSSRKLGLRGRGVTIRYPHDTIRIAILGENRKMNQLITIVYYVAVTCRGNTLRLHYYYLIL